MSGAPLLGLARVSAGYGETVVIEDIDLGVGEGESVSVIGRNGVGKTTLLATVMGHTTMHGGAIAIGGVPIAAAESHRRARAGLGYVPQEREIFPSLTVVENLAVAARPGRWTRARVFDLFPQLRARASNRGSQLSGGEQQMLAIARALMGNPRILLMDEPSEGLAPVVVEELVRAIMRLRDEERLAIVLVEQNTRVALDLSPRTVVMDRGRVVYDGPSAALRDDPKRLGTLIGLDSAAV
ncbi:MAG: ABC transporter ATP-binding protein [Alphaproteobacteria bacterium]|nr:ABC transporter ATP-binding protein [Alphaproteobacteria bacterium]